MLAIVCWACVLGYAPIARAFLYWGASGAIGRANIDGSGVDPSFISFGGVTPGSIAVDGSHIYWAQYTTGVERANLNGTGLDRTFFGGSGAQAVAVDASHMYWSQEPGVGGITRANIDGSGVNQSFITNVAPPCSGCSVRATVLGVAVDAQHIYWASFRTSSSATIATIGRANLDGSGADPGFITLPVNYEPLGLAVDGQHLYWSYGTGSTQGIGSASTSGSGVNLNLISVPGFGVGGIALDSSHIYWAEVGGGSGPSAIGRANLDGSGANLSFITGLSGASAVAVDQSSPTITISGTVRTFQGLDPGTRGVSGVTVALDGADQAARPVHLTTRTGSDGSYQFTVAHGIYTIAPNGDPRPQANPRDDPPRGGRYVTTACSGPQLAAGCQVITAGLSGTSATADFAYGQDHRLAVSFAPVAVPDDGLGESTLTVSLSDLRGAPVADQWLLAHTDPTAFHAVVCPVRQGVVAPSPNHPRAG